VTLEHFICNLSVASAGNLAESTLCFWFYKWKCCPNLLLLQYFNSQKSTNHFPCSCFL